MPFAPRLKPHGGALAGGLVGAAIVAELAGIMRCLITGVPFGRAFRYAIAAQFVAPILVVGVFAVWGLLSPATQGPEPLTGTIWDRFYWFMNSLVLTVLGSLVAASFLSVRTFFHSSERSNTNDRNA